MAIEAQVGLIHGGGLQVVGGEYELRHGSASRAVAGIELYHLGVVERLLFSGGNAHGQALSVSEAGLMADLAIKNDVPVSHIDCEEASSSTIGNWANSLPVLQAAGTEKVLGVTGRVASHRAGWIGQELIDRYDFPIEIASYHPSGEIEGFRAYPREIASSLMAQRCLQAAGAENVGISQLDDFYLAWKARTGLAHAKLHLTRR